MKNNKYRDYIRYNGCSPTYFTKSGMSYIRYIFAREPGEFFMIATFGKFLDFNLG